MKNIRKTLFLIAGLAPFTPAAAQTLSYAPFPDSAVVWREELSGLAFNCCCSGNVCLYEDHYQIYSSGDTVANGYTYMKIYKTGFNVSYIGGPYTCPPGCTNYNPVYYTAQYAGGLRQDTLGRKVYLLEPFTGQDTLLYDFDLALGDTLPPAYNNMIPDNVVSNIDSVLVGGQYHRRFWLSANGTTDYAAIIEGIGSTFGLLFPLYPPFEFFNTLLCVTVDGQPVYPDTSITCVLISGTGQQDQPVISGISPNPAKNRFTITATHNISGADIRVYSAFGRLVAAGRMNGITHDMDIQTGSGIYLIRISCEDGYQWTGKLMVE